MSHKGREERSLSRLFFFMHAHPNTRTPPHKNPDRSWEVHLYLFFFWVFFSVSFLSPLRKQPRVGVRGARHSSSLVMLFFSVSFFLFFFLSLSLSSKEGRVPRSRCCFLFCFSSLKSLFIYLCVCVCVCLTFPSSTLSMFLTT